MPAAVIAASVLAGEPCALTWHAYERILAVDLLATKRPILFVQACVHRIEFLLGEKGEVRTIAIASAVGIGHLYFRQ